MYFKHITKLAQSLTYHLQLSGVQVEIQTDDYLKAALASGLAEPTVAHASDVRVVTLTSTVERVLRGY